MVVGYVKGLCIPMCVACKRIGDSYLRAVKSRPFFDCIAFAMLSQKPISLRLNRLRTSNKTCLLSQKLDESIDPQEGGEKRHGTHYNMVIGQPYHVLYLTLGKVEGALPHPHIAAKRSVIDASPLITFLLHHLRCHISSVSDPRPSNSLIRSASERAHYICSGRVFQRHQRYRQPFRVGCLQCTASAAGAVPAYHRFHIIPYAR